MTDERRSPFQIELDKVQQTLLEMAGLAEGLVERALEALKARDAELAQAVRRADDEVDALEVELDERVLTLLALQGPLARDLRFVFVASKATNDLERIGDHAVNIAKAVIRLAKHPPLPELPQVWEMGTLARRMLGDALSALINRDARAAELVIEADERIDELRSSTFRIIVSYMLEQPRYISPGLELILIIQNLERVGDLATNVAEDVIFLVEGKQVRHAKRGGTA
ncbi:MAG: phosphate signaling complex protein PhoU [Gemmatimonadetes bacterium]|nr:phosphate signaling complex protein PhoU [Gemmatimonadota bacterium]